MSPCSRSRPTRSTRKSLPPPPVGVNTVAGPIAVDGKPAVAKSAAPSAKPAAAAPAPPKEEKKAAPIPTPMPAPPAAAHEEEDEARSSPLVRKIAREHVISLSPLKGP